MTTNAPPSRDPANDDSLTGAFKLILRKMTQNLDDMLPCIVISHDRDANRVHVRPIIRIVDTLQNQHSRDVLASVPVLNLGAGGFFINFNIPAGSLGWIKASDRDISLFLQSYKEEAPNTQRMHSFSDGLFIPDTMTGYTIDGEDDEAMVIQNLSGSVKIALDETSIRLINGEVRGEFTSENITMSAPSDINLNAENITLTATSTLILNGDTIGMTAPSGVTINNVTIDAAGAVASPVSFTAPNGVFTSNVSFGGVDGLTHTHPQGPDSAGDTQENTGAPIV